MIQKKLCMLGAFAVGKTSLTRRFVHSLYSDKYLTTVGVKIEKKPLAVDGQDLNLVIWDIQGEDEFGKINPAYLRGAAGYFLVADGTRAATLDTVLEIARSVETTSPEAARVLALNKSDLADAWELPAARIAELAAAGWTVVKTSARSGDGVEDAFASLARQMLVRQR